MIAVLTTAVIRGHGSTMEYMEGKANARNSRANGCHDDKWMRLSQLPHEQDSEYGWLSSGSSAICSELRTVFEDSLLPKCSPFEPENALVDLRGLQTLPQNNIA